MAAQKLTVADVKNEVFENRLQGVSRGTINTVIKAFIEEVHDSLANGYAVNVPGLGTWEPVLKPGRKKGSIVRNPFTGEERKLRADEPDKFFIKVKKPSGLAKRIMPSIKSKAGKELAAQLAPARKKVAKKKTGKGKK